RVGGARGPGAAAAPPRLHPERGRRAPDDADVALDFLLHPLLLGADAVQEADRRKPPVDFRVIVPLPADDLGARSRVIRIGGCRPAWAGGRGGAAGTQPRRGQRPLFLSL